MRKNASPKPELDCLISKTFVILRLFKGRIKMIKKEKLKEISQKLTKNQENFISSFRQNLFMYVNDKEITLNDISVLSGIPYATLNSFLYGKCNNVRIDNVVKLARTFEVSIDELVGAETINELTLESIKICRNLPENDLMLVRWFIRCLADLNSQNEPNKRYVSVMLPEENNNGDCKLVSKFEKLEITDLKEPLKSKIFIGFKIISNYYLPYYYPNDIVLVANDRPAKQNEHIIVRAGDYIFIVKKVIENGISKLFSIRDDKYRMNESEIDELIGYITHTCKDY